MTNLIDFPENPLEGDFYVDPSGDKWLRIEHSWRRTTKENINPSFLTTWNISAGDSITLPLTATGTYDFVVKWGDGTSDSILSYDQTEITHIYDQSGEYQISIDGVCSEWNMTGSADATKLLEVNRLGVCEWTSFEGMFNQCTNLSLFEVGISDTSKVTSTKQMFKGCLNLLEFAPETFDTGSVLDMSEMFMGCVNTTLIDLSLFNTSLVTDMSYMFDQCAGVSVLDMSGFSTTLVTDFSNMFRGCILLEGLDVSGFATAASTSMTGMFKECFALVSLDVSGFDTSSVLDMSYMFDQCEKIGSLNVTGFNTSLVTTFSYMFNGCFAIFGLDVSNFNTVAATDLSMMFASCEKIDVLNVVGFTTSLVTDLDGAFSNCPKLTDINISGWDVSNLLTAIEMFNDTNAYIDSLYDDVLLAWSVQTVQPDVVISFGNARFINYIEKDILLNAPNNWIITDGGSLRPFLIDISPTDAVINEITEHTITGNWFTPSTTVTVGTGATINSVTYISPTKLKIVTTGGNNIVTLPLTIKNGAYDSYGAALDLVVTFSQHAFVFTWTPDFSWRQMELPTYGTGDFQGSDFNFDYHVDWGDGTSDDCVGYDDPNRIHVYGDTNEHTVMITGLYESQHFENGIYVTNWRKILNLGNVGWKSWAWAFNGMTGVTEVTIGTDIGDGDPFIDIVDCTRAFTGCQMTSMSMGTNSLENVQDFSYMFSGCDEMISIDLSGINLSSATNMSYMFQNCTDLRYLNLDGANLPNMTTFVNTFAGCYYMRDLSMVGVNAPECLDMSYMFQGVGGGYFGSKITLDNSSFPKVATTYQMFNNAGGDNPASKVSMVNVDMTGNNYNNWMFWLADFGEVDMTGVKMPTCSSFYRMFYAANIDILKVPNLLEDHVGTTSCQEMFYQCGHTGPMDLTTWNTGGVTNMNSMFAISGKITDLNISTWDTSNCNNMYNMFASCGDITNQDLSGWDTSKVTTMARMFYYNNGRTSIDVSAWNVEKVTDMSFMFYRVQFCTTINMTGWVTSAVTTLYNMFENCDVLEHCDVSHFDIRDLTTAREMFQSSNSAMTQTEYDTLLLAWSAQTPLPNIDQFWAGTMNYTEVAARAILTGAGWSIIDGSPV